jgi:hypothetical protein
MITTFARTAAFAAAALVAALPAAAASDPRPNTAISAPAAKVAKDSTYCVKPVVTGTRINKAIVCKKRSAWIADTGIDPARQ